MTISIDKYLQYLGVLVIGAIQDILDGPMMVQIDKYIIIHTNMSTHAVVNPEKVRCGITTAENLKSVGKLRSATMCHAHS